MPKSATLIAPVARDEHVCRLHVEVQHAVVVRELERVRDRADHRGGLIEHRAAPGCGRAVRRAEQPSTNSMMRNASSESVSKS